MGSESSNLTQAGTAVPSSVAALQGKLIEDDRVCPGCSYNLKGMRTGDRCPECGTPIPMKVGARQGWLMTHSPVEWLRGLAHGSVWMLVSIGVLLPALIWIVVEFLWTSGFTRVVGAFAVLAGLGWTLGVWKVTVPRPQEPGNPGSRVAEWRALRWFVRCSQAAWAAGSALWFNAGWLAAAAGARIVATPGTVPVSVTGLPRDPRFEALALWGLIFLVVGMLGVSLLAFYLALLADWADDPALARKLRLTPLALFGAMFFAAVLVAARPLLHDLPILFVLIPTLAVTGGLFLLCASHFGVALVQFATIGVWAQQNAATALDSGRRMSAKIVKRITDGQAKAPTTPVKAPRGHRPSKPQGAYVAPTGSGQGYELAPPSEGPSGPTQHASRPAPGKRPATR